MREKMKKMLFLMLFLLVLGAANVNSQVRIGGNGQPNTAAVLDLNATDATINGTKGLALPRVSLASTTDQLGSATLLNGMLVYNTNTSSGAGVYYWDTNKWVKVSGGEFVGNEITDTIANGGLTRSGAGTAEDPYKVGIKTNGIVNSMIADRAVSLSKISTAASDSGSLLMSDGVGAVAVRFNNTSYQDTAVITLKAPRSVAWTNILDTLLSIPVNQHRYTVEAVAGLREGDYCYEANQHHLLQFHVGFNSMRISTLQTSTNGLVPARIVCFRPSY
ncbi:hypothetical protein FACS189451_05950 [Bacteroidia bacterium]|nr:hypothetical protein FACS189451_05950 [Bacteroidia bacterium]